MKKILFIVIGALILISGFFWYRASLPDRQEGSQKIIEEVTLSSVISSYQSPTVSWNGKMYAYELFEISDYSTIFLLPNFENRESAIRLIEQNGCRNAINAGFYNTSYEPLGSWKNDEGARGIKLESALFNGFYSVFDSSADLTWESVGTPRLRVQTGPMLIWEGNPLKLAIKNDEPARRSVVGITSTGTSVFLSIFDPESVYSGPMLGDIPAVLAVLPMSLTSAINLDGGNASLFMNANRTLSELSPVGSLFCVQ